MTSVPLASIVACLCLFMLWAQAIDHWGRPGKGVVCLGVATAVLLLGIGMIMFMVYVIGQQSMVNQ